MAVLFRSASMSSATASGDPGRAWMMSYFKDALRTTAGPTTVCAGRHIELDPGKALAHPPEAVRLESAVPGALVSTGLVLLFCIQRVRS
jgi:hypothetical protein